MLGDCGHCHVTGRPVTSPTHIHCQYKYSPKPETSVFRHSQQTSVPAPWNMIPQLANMQLPRPFRGNPAISPDPGWHPSPSLSLGVSWLTRICSHLPGHTPELIRSRSPLTASIPEDNCCFESHQVIAESGGGKRK